MGSHQHRYRYALLSVGAALFTLALTFLAYVLTGSISLLSAAAELLVNLVAACVALWALWLAAQPADEGHAYGHTKAEYFSSAVEGALIIVAAIGIVWTAVPHLTHPHPLQQVGLGLPIAAVAAAINGGVAVALLRAGRRMNSVALTADGQHLLTDVWTTVGVLVSVLLVALTGWLALDPIIALVVAANIIWTGWRLEHESGLGLLDSAIVADDLAKVHEILATYRERGIGFHAIRSRRAGVRRFISMHVLVPGSWTVQRGHDLCEELELAVRRALPETTVFTHLEPREDPVAFQDTELDRRSDGVTSASEIR